MNKNDKDYCIFLTYHNGNGLTVYRRGESEDIVAHITPMRELKVSKGKELKPWELEYLIIESLTDDRQVSVTQEQKVFKTPPATRVLINTHYIMMVSKSGYLGTLPNGYLVDRRIYPNATEVQKNSMFGIIKPKKL